MTDPVMLLSQVHGEGRVTFHALRAAGFLTLAAVAEVQVQALAERAQLSPQTARRLKTGAEQMLGKGIGAPVAAEGAVARASRTPDPRASKPSPPVTAPLAPVFSEGVSLAEASLLGQGSVPTKVEETPGEPAPQPREPAGKPERRPQEGSAWSFG